MEALRELEQPAALAQQADDLVTMLDDSDDDDEEEEFEDDGEDEEDEDEDGEEDVRETALDPRADDLVTMLDESDDEEEEEEFVDPRADDLVAMLDDSDRRVREEALETLGQFEPATLARHADALIAMQGDCSWWVRCGKADAVQARSGDARAACPRRGRVARGLRLARA